MKKNLERRIIFFSFLILLLTVIADSGMNIYAFRKDYISALVLRSQSISVALRGTIEKVVALGIDIREIPGVDDKCREIVSTNSDLAYCVVTDSDGALLFANDRSQYPPQDLVSGKHIVSGDHRTVLVGTKRPYYDTMTPIKAPDGKLVGFVHIGIPVKSIMARVETMVMRSALILVMFFLLAFTLVIIFVKRSIIHPIALLLGGVKKIAAGGFDEKIEKLPVYEFNELARNINSMSDALKTREEEIRSSYENLERTHTELHNSYLRLENLSLDLERSETLYKSLLQDAGDAILVVDSAEVIRLANKKSEDFFGFSAGTLVGLNFKEMLHRVQIDNLSLVYNHFQEALSGKHFELDVHFVRGGDGDVDGRILAIAVQSGDESFVQAIIRDVTLERRVMFNLEKSTADLARLNRMKDSFLGLASHELKTPLTVIMGYSELILSDMTEKVDKTVLAMIENILNAASRLDTIVKDMVDVSLIDEKRLHLKMEDIDLNRVVESSVNELRFFFSLRHQALHINLDQTLPRIKGDSIRLMQLLGNVLGNAIKFTPDGGQVTVTTRITHLLRSKQPFSPDHMHPVLNIGKELHPYVLTSISDTGIGIDEEDQLRIFEKFYEVGNIEEHSSGKVAFKGKGAGLGLAIAKGIVEMHGGEIWVDSSGCDPHNFPGSTFHIILPFNPITGDGTIDYLNLQNRDITLTREAGDE